MADELARLEAELGEVDLLDRAGQDRSGPPRDATRRRGREDQHRHGGGRAAGASLEPAVAAELNTQLVLLTKRAALMESQVDVLEGKRRALVAIATRSRPMSRR